MEQSTANAELGNGTTLERNELGNGTNSGTGGKPEDSRLEEAKRKRGTLRLREYGTNSW